MKTKRKNSQHIHRKRFLLGWIAAGIAVLSVAVFTLLGVTALGTDYVSGKSSINPVLFLLLASLTTSLVLGHAENFVSKRWLPQSLPKWGQRTAIAGIVSSLIGYVIVQEIPSISGWWLVVIYLSGVGLIQSILLRDFFNRNHLWLIVHAVGGIVAILPAMLYGLTYVPHEICTAYGFDNTCLSIYFYETLFGFEMSVLGVLGLFGFVAITGLTLLYLMENERIGVIA